MRYVAMMTAQCAQRWLRSLTVMMLAAGFGLASGITPPPASGAFARPLLRQIPGTPAGPFAAPGGVTVDEHDNLWVGDGALHNSLDEFSPAYATSEPNKFVVAFPIEAFTFPEILATDRANGHVYVTGQNQENSEHAVEVFDSSGAFVERWKQRYIPPRDDIAFDNTANVLYLSTSSAKPSVEKLSPAGTPVAFSAAAPYVKGNQIVGVPTGSGGCDRGFEGTAPPGAVTVDPQGDIFVVDPGCRAEAPAILEYLPSGEFVRAFTGESTPGIDEDHQLGGFGGFLQGLAVDPLDNHLLVTVDNISRPPHRSAIDEFDIKSGRFLNQIAEAPGGGGLQDVAQITVDSKGDTYVVDRATLAVDVYGPGRFLPTLELARVSDLTPEQAVLNGAVNPESLNNPEGAGLDECQFEYVSETQFKLDGFASASRQACTPPAATIPKDGSFHPVRATVTGLQSGTTYRYRLFAKTEGALGGSGASASLAFTAPHAPSIEATSADNPSSTFADLHAQINPLGASTSYQFQYVDAAHYQPEAANPYAAGASAPLTPEPIGSGGLGGDQRATVLQHVGGLLPNTTYHYRALATNAFGTAASNADHTFTTLGEPTSGLPDGRAYELVTPVNKNSASDMFAASPDNYEHVLTDIGTPSDTGNGFLLQTDAAFGQFPAAFGNDYALSRTAAGWSLTSLASPSLGVQSVADPAFDPTDLSRFAVNDNVGSNASEAGLKRTTLTGPPGGPYTTLHTDAATHGLQHLARGETRVVGASHDVSHVLLQGYSHDLCPGAEGRQHAETEVLCEWNAGALALVNLTSQETLLSACGAVLGQDPTDLEGSAHNAVSRDGSKVFFTAPDPHAVSHEPGCWNGARGNAPQLNPPQLYLRSGGLTTLLSAPEAGFKDPSGRHPAAYVGASEDGSRVFFLTRAELTKDDAGIHDLELYEYNTETSALRRISAGASGHADGQLYTVPAISADGSAVYFTAFGVLAPGAAALKEPVLSAEDVPVNLYRYDAVRQSTSYISTVRSLEAPTESASHWFGEGPERSPVPSQSWYATPDGSYLLYASSSEVTGQSTVGPCRLPHSQGLSNGHCEALYRYHFEKDAPGEGSVICISCNPSGAPPTSNALFGRSALTTPSSGPQRAMSDNGAYIAFDTADALVPEDTNGTLDVYEWHEGQIALISSGKDAAPSFFLGMDAGATNIFFGTHARLVAQDADTAGDVYDARICSEAEPCIKPPPSETAQCEGDACQLALAFAPAGFPATQGLASTGNLTPPPLLKSPATLTNAQRLAKTLKACRKKSRSQRRRCEAQARKRHRAPSSARSHAKPASTRGRASR